MMTCRLQIENGLIEDSLERWGFIMVDSDRRTAAPEKKRATSSYIGEPGEHEDEVTVEDAFDYKVKFVIDTPNTDTESANAKIRAFNEAIRELDGFTKKTKKITLYNDWMRVKVTGTPEVIDEPSEFYRRQDNSRMDCVEIELKIRVTQPQLCCWDLEVEQGII